MLLFWDDKPISTNAIYALNEDLSRGVRVYGSGPVILRPESVTSYFKYDSSTKEFKKLSSNGFTVTTDAVSIPPSNRHKKGLARAAASEPVLVHNRPGGR